VADDHEQTGAEDQHDAIQRGSWALVRGEQTEPIHGGPPVMVTHPSQHMYGLKLIAD
jgi:hypothetical protein